MSTVVPQYSSFFHCLFDQPRAPNGGCWGGYSVFRAIDARDVRQRPTQTPQVHDFAVLWDEDHDTRIIAVIEEMLMAGMLPGVQFIGERKGYITVLLAPPTHEIDTQAYAERISNFTDLINGDYWSCEVGMFDNRPENLITQHQCELGSILRTDAVTTHAFLLTIDQMWQLGTKEYVPVDAKQRHPLPSRYRVQRPLHDNGIIPAGSTPSLFAAPDSNALA